MKHKKESSASTYLSITAVVIIGLVVFFAFHSNILQSLSPASITSFPTTTYKVPVGGTITVPYTINTWDGRQWVWSDLDRYQYEYTIYDNVTGGNPLAYGRPWRLIHDVSDSISLKMNREGTYNMRLEETIVFLKTGERRKGDVRTFTVIVGSGISPSPTPTPTGFGGTAALEQPIAVQTETVTSTPIPTTSSSINQYQSTINSAPTATARATATQEPQSAYTALPTPRQPQNSIQATPIISPTPIPETTLSFIPPTPEPTPVETPASPGFEAVFIAIALCLASSKVHQRITKTNNRRNENPI